MQSVAAPLPSIPLWAITDTWSSFTLLRIIGVQAVMILEETLLLRFIPPPECMTARIDSSHPIPPRHPQPVAANARRSEQSSASKCSQTLQQESMFFFPGIFHHGVEGYNMKFKIVQILDSVGMKEFTSILGLEARTTADRQCTESFRCSPKKLQSAITKTWSLDFGSRSGVPGMGISDG